MAPLAALLERLSPGIRARALSHRSYVPARADSYERLEFLGDAVLQLVVSDELMRRHPAADEGDLSWMRQSVVSGASCARVAAAAALDEAMVQVAPRRARAAARDLSGKESVRAGLTEAVIGAVWTELGPEEASAAVLESFADALDAAEPGRRDPKTELQEEAERRGEDLRYVLVEQRGPAHEPVFVTDARIGGRAMGRGEGRSKQSSEAAAAAEALGRLGGDRR